MDALIEFLTHPWFLYPAITVISVSLIAVLSAWKSRAPDDTLFLACLRWVNKQHVRWIHSLERPQQDPLPATGSGILVANHRSGLDPTAILSQTNRVIRFLIAKEYYEIFFLKPIFTRIRLIPVNRNGNDLSAVKQSLKALKNDEFIGLFPSGGIQDASESSAGDTESNDSQTEDEMKHGAALLALKTGAPIYPVYVEGTPNFGSVLLAFFFPSKSRIHFGKPFTLPQPQAKAPSKEELEQGTIKIQRAIREASPQEATAKLSPA